LTFHFIVGSAGFTSGFNPLIEQDGKYYDVIIQDTVFPPGTTESTGYRTISKSGFVAADFTEFDFNTGAHLPGTPDFSGDPILFGLRTGFINNGGTVVRTVEDDWDNLIFDISPVSEPSSLLLLAFGLLGVAGIGLARRKRLLGETTLRCSA
jgi:hypothetical protein